MGEYVMTCAIFVCLLALALIAFAKPLRTLLRLSVSAAVGGTLLYLGQSLGAAVGLNAATLTISAILGVPGVLGLYILGFLL
ncbi:MAG: pro-sigmaK processing inhibitor BofA family protein [Anaerotignum sp.]|nr:pro-sigmaK processing inhibitor BofA family protein [Anaerotignum sp.]MBQ7102548.1 pro-sigmaK processing inhibitor BofA family protein [Anaerotignum sp.]